MVNIAAIISAVLLALAALFALKNKSAVEEFQQATESLKAEKEKMTADLKLSQKDVVDTELQIKEVTASTTELESQLVNIEAEIATIGESISVKEEEREANKGKIAGAQENIDAVGDVDVLISEVRDKQESLDNMQTEIITAESRLALVTSQVEAAQREVDRLQGLKSTTANNASSADLNTSIRSALNSQGFVIINGGDNRGVAANSTLSVVRGGNEIAKVKVTTVETNSAAASLIPDTLKEGYTLRSGDRVVASVSAN